jgi:hypothetical protein
VGAGTTASTTTNIQPTSSKLKQSASGIKGLAAAVHGAGEAIRGNFNAGVDKAFHDVCAPSSVIVFPDLRVLGKEFGCEDE